MSIAHAFRPRTSQLTLAALLLLFASLSAPALAAEDEEAAEAAPPAGQERLPKESTFRVLGAELKGPSGIVVGQVVNVLVDESGGPRAVVLDYGGFLGVGKRRIAVAWPVVRFGPKGALLTLTRDQLKSFPEYREGEEVVMATTTAAQPH